MAIHLPAALLNQKGSYKKLRDRNSIDFPLLGIAARLKISDNIVDDCALCVVALQARPCSSISSGGTPMANISVAS